jgi:putative hydrolase of the HAD superfamily
MAVTKRGPDHPRKEPLPDAVLLDLDDTILDDSGCVESSWTDACAEAATILRNVDANALKQAIQEYASWWWSSPERHVRGRLNLRAATAEIVEEVFRTKGFGTTRQAQDLAERYRDLREERACLLPGALQTIDRLRTLGVRLGMMTNGAGAAQRAKIERFDLSRHFDHIVIEGELGVGKPNRLVFDTLLTKLDVSAQEAWAVGDNLEFDVLAPMELGIHGVWLDPLGRGCSGDRRPDRIVAALSDLLV